MEKPLIVFDVGNTILEIDESKYGELSQVPKFWDNLRLLECSDITPWCFINQLAVKTKLSFSEITFKFNSIITGKFLNDMGGVISTLTAKGYDIYLLSNTNILHWSYFSQFIGNFYKHAFLSFDLGCRKPNKNIFATTNAIINCKNDKSIIFFDDDIDNRCEAEQSVGWITSEANEYKACMQVIDYFKPS